MFTQNVNAACINAAFSGATIAPMDASIQRLLACAQRATADGPPLQRVKTLRDLRDRLGWSAGRLTNYKTRGISKEGAIEAEGIS